MVALPSLKPSSHVRVDDIRRLLRLFGECREIEGGGSRPARHFLEGLARITRALVALQVDATGIHADAPPVMGRVHDIGWANDADRDRVYGHVAGQPLGADPLTRALVERNERVVTVSRADVVTPSDWERSMVRNDIHRASSIDESLVSMVRKGGECVSVIALKRAWGERPFCDEERDLLDLAHGECAWVFRDDEAQTPLDIHWSPRERETLGLLLTGQSEKAIAATLGLSPHTVHDYVKVIFRKVGVASRAELMARALSAPPRLGDG
ncbi:MAG TPA: helix-turn-helix transcriptional regulator [Labilithrix sp.]|jgi:DNA-binding CsgD family transcriptional regulator